MEAVQKKEGTWGKYILEMEHYIKSADKMNINSMFHLCSV
jgi:hypothetical protein